MSGDIEKKSRKTNISQKLQLKPGYLEVQNIHSTVEKAQVCIAENGRKMIPVTDCLVQQEEVQGCEHSSVTS